MALLKTFTGETCKISLSTDFVIKSAPDLCTYCKKFWELVKESNFIEIQGKVHQSSHEEHSVINAAKIIKAAFKEHIIPCVHICVSNKRCFYKMEGIIQVKSMQRFFHFPLSPKVRFFLQPHYCLKCIFFSSHFPSFVKDECRNMRIMILWPPKCGSLFYFDLMEIFTWSVWKKEREEQMSATNEGWQYLLFGWLCFVMFMKSSGEW